MTPVDWELDNSGLRISNGLDLRFPYSDGHCILVVDGEYKFNLPYRALKQFVDRVESQNLNRGPNP